MLDAHRPAPGRPEPDGFAWRYLSQLFRGEITALGAAEQSDWSHALQLAVAPDSGTIAAGMADGRGVVWDLIDERIRHTLCHQASGPGSGVYYVGFSGDGRFLASGSVDCVVKIWDMETGRERAVLPAQAGGAPVLPGGIVAPRFTETSDGLVVFRQGGASRSSWIQFWSVPVPGGQAKLQARLAPFLCGWTRILTGAIGSGHLIRPQRREK